MYRRLYKPLEKQSFFLFGPRGVGKSAWLRAHFKADLSVDLLNARSWNELQADPSRLELMLPKNAASVVIDEIQMVPALLNEVHRLIESRRIRFALTGSSARKLKRAQANMLAGRAFTTFMHPLTAHELGDDFDLAKSLRVGHLPMAYGSDHPEDYLQSYVRTYLKEEVQQEGFVRNLEGFSRFLEAASFSQGQVLNISKVAAEAGVERKMTEEYFRILEDFLVALRLPPFRRRASRRVARHPKFYYFDCGVYRAIRPRGPLDSPEEAEGAALETLVLQELRAMNEYLRLQYEIYYWNVVQGPEVDFVLYGKNGLIAIEVKRAGRLRGGELDGLRAFLKEYPAAKAMLVYLGPEERLIDGIRVIPVQKFFTGLAELLLDPS